MPQDTFQIALEHHHAGRLIEAEASYRKILDSSPHDADALGWLGVLTLQAGEPIEAISLLERALAERPEDPAFWNNLGQAYLAARRFSHAIWALEVSVGLHPGRADALYAIGYAELQRGEPGDAEEAVNRFDQARASGLDSAELHLHRGVALLLSGKTDAAKTALLAAAERTPDNAEIHYHLGVISRHEGNTPEARQRISRALELNPQYARACEGLAVLETDTGNFPAAEVLFRRAIQLKPTSVAAHRGLGAVLHKLGREAEAQKEMERAVQLTHSPASAATGTTGSASEAIAALERKLTPSAESAALHFWLATTTNIAPPPSVPREKVSGLYDRYADLFDEHLRDRLGYRVPELIADALSPLRPDRLMDVLDIGCGTGLCGALLRPMAGSLIGVDLSPAMLEKAANRQVYDRLEAVDFMEVLRRGGHTYDLLVAADVLIYVGDLAPTFAAARTSLRAGGMFAFTVEAGTATRYQLNQTTHRYTHSTPYIRRLSAMYDFDEVVHDDIVVREEGGVPVAGFLVVLRKKAEQADGPQG